MKVVRKRWSGETEKFLSQFYLDDSNAFLTTDVGGPISDQESLSAGERGPALLEDFIFRQKIQYFDHERVPERAVHARGADEILTTLMRFGQADFSRRPWNVCILRRLL